MNSKPAVLLSQFPAPKAEFVAAVKSAAKKGRGVNVVGIIPRKVVEVIDDSISAGRTLIDLPKK